MFQFCYVCDNMFTAHIPCFSSAVCVTTCSPPTFRVSVLLCALTTCSQPTFRVSVLLCVWQHVHRPHSMFQFCCVRDNMFTAHVPCFSSAMCVDNMFTAHIPCFSSAVCVTTCSPPTFRVSVLLCAWQHVHHPHSVFQFCCVCDNMFTAHIPCFSSAVCVTTCSPPTFRVSVLLCVWQHVHRPHSVFQFCYVRWQHVHRPRSLFQFCCVRDNMFTAHVPCFSSAMCVTTCSPPTFRVSVLLCAWQHVHHPHSVFQFCYVRWQHVHRPRSLFQFCYVRDNMFTALIPCFSSAMCVTTCSQPTFRVSVRLCAWQHVQSPHSMFQFCCVRDNMFTAHIGCTLLLLAIICCLQFIIVPTYVLYVYYSVKCAYKEPAYKDLPVIRNWFSFPNLYQGDWFTILL